MPIFEYKCEACGKEFEELVFKEGDTVPCPECQSENTDKLMSCCRFKTAGSAVSSALADAGGVAPAAPSAPSGCAGCSGGNCSTC